MKTSLTRLDLNIRGTRGAARPICALALRANCPSLNPKAGKGFDSIEETYHIQI